MRSTLRAFRTVAFRRTTATRPFDPAACDEAHDRTPVACEAIDEETEALLASTGEVVDPKVICLTCGFPIDDHPSMIRSQPDFFARANEIVARHRGREEPTPNGPEPEPVRLTQLAADEVIPAKTSGRPDRQDWLTRMEREQDED